MRKHSVFHFLFSIGVILLISSILLSYVIDEDIKQLGLKAYQEKHGISGKLMFFGFALFFPLGIVFLILGGITLCHKQKTKLLFMVLTTAALSVFMVSWPAVVGRQHVSGYFGIGGVTMLILIVLVIWQWSHYRHHASAGIRRALDFKALGYYCFALAAWNTCGTLALPGYGIYPDKMQQQFNYEFVVGQTKVVMLYFVLAWLFTFIGMRIAAKVSHS